MSDYTVTIYYENHDITHAWISVEAPNGNKLEAGLGPAGDNILGMIPNLIDGQGKIHNEDHRQNLESQGLNYYTLGGGSRTLDEDSGKVLFEYVQNALDMQKSDPSSVDYSLDSAFDNCWGWIEKAFEKAGLGSVADMVTPADKENLKDESDLTFGTPNGGDVVEYVTGKDIGNEFSSKLFELAVGVLSRFENAGEAIDKAIEWAGDKVEGALKWLFGGNSEDTTADKSKVLDQQVGSNTGYGVGDGQSAIHIETSSILSMVGDMIGSFVGMIGGAIDSIVSGISSIGSTIGGMFSGFFGFIGDLFSGGGNETGGASSGGFSVAVPVIIDLNNDGVNLSNVKDSSVFFDIDGDGYLEKTAWADKEDALLVIDLFKDGKVDFAEEVNFKLWDETAKTDMQALRNVFDSNQNNQIDAGDERFDEFKIWQDINQNGRVDEGELKTLAEAGINSINIDSRVPTSDKDGQVVADNIVYDTTAINWANGNAGKAYDIGLIYSIGGIRLEGSNNEFSINYEDGREVKVYQAPDAAPLDMDAASNDYDVVVATDASDHITNNSARDVILDGGKGDDVLEGGAGDDWLYGAAGADSLRGNDGNDILFIDASDDLANIDGGAGDDIAVVTSIAAMNINITDHNIEKIFGNNGNDNFTATGNVAVKMDGGAGDDSLTAAGGDDKLTGGDGNDILNGKGGNNFLTGGLGSDRYIIELNAGTTTEINSFDAHDKAEKIDLSAFNLSELVIITDNTNTTINLGGNQFINLTNTNLSALDKDNFIFKAGTNPKIVKHIHGGSGSEIIKGSNTDDIIDVGGGSNYVVTGRGNDVVYTNPDALDVIKITRQAGKIDTIYGFNSYGLTQFTYWMGQFDGNTATGVGTVRGRTTPELWQEKTKMTVFSNTKFDLTEFGYLKDMGNIGIYTQGNDTIIDLQEGQKIILKDYVQKKDTKSFMFGRNSEYQGGTESDQFIVDYDITKAAVTVSNFIFTSDGSNIGSLIDDDLHGSPYMDSLIGSDGNDKIFGYEGTDLLVGGQGKDYLDGGANNDGISGNENDDEIHGGSGNDALWGKDGNDIIYGDSGQDFLIGGTGSDMLYGGDDEDTYIFSVGDGRDVIIDNGLNNSNDVLSFKGNITRDSLVLSKDGNDLVITFKGNSTDRIIIKDQYAFGNNGIESLRFADNTQILLSLLNINIAGTNLGETLIGTNKDDIISGGRGDDLLKGLEGNDSYLFNTGDGKDIIDETGSLSNADSIKMGGGIIKSSVTHEKVGNDLVIHFANNSSDQIIIKNQYNNDNSRIETIYFNDGSEINLVTAGVNINGTSGSNNIGGTDYNDNIYGGAGDDVLEGGVGADFIDGGTGDDIISYKNSNAAVTVNLLTNIASGGDANGDMFNNIEGAEGSGFGDVLTGNNIANRLYGLDGNDIIYGNGGNDKIYGGDGEDRIVGGDGDDYIDGGNGADLLEGNAGNDSIFGGAGGDTILGGDGNDYLSGGTEGDLIDGGNGDDHLSTGFGNDTLIGAAGADKFTISKSAGVEQVIKDFERNVSGEKIDLWAFSQIHNFAELKMLSSGLDTLIDLGNRQVLRIKNIAPNQLTADDFVFRQEPKEFVVNSSRAGWQDTPSIASLDNGNFVVTWQSAADKSVLKFDIKGRIFEADGTPQGTEFSVSSTSNTSLYSHVEGLSNGKFAVVWMEYSESTGFCSYAQIFGSSGQKIGNKLDIANGKVGLFPNITELSNGNFLTAWEGVIPSNFGYGLGGQVFDQNGNKVGSQIHLNTIDNNVMSFGKVSLTALANNHFVVTWTAVVPIPEDSSVRYDTYLQIYDNAGNIAGTEVKLLSGQEYYDQSGLVRVGKNSDVVVHSLVNNNFIVAWRSQDYVYPYDNEKVTGQMFNSNGEKLGDKFEIATPSWYKQKPNITSLDDGGFVVSWSMYNNPIENDWSEGIYAQRFRADGLKLGEEYHLNDTTAYDQLHPDITQLASGDFVVTWDSYVNAASRTDIFAKISSVVPVVVNHPVYNHTILADKEFILQLPYDTFLDAHGLPLSYSATLANGLQLPTWLTFNSATLTFKGTPGSADAGSVGIRITASDGSEKITDSFNINITTSITDSLGNKTVAAEGSIDKDVLHGTEFNDAFIGHGGNDIYVISKDANNTDIIKDFEVDIYGLGNILDKIDLSAFTNIKSFADLQTRISVDPKSHGSAVIIDLGNEQTLMLENIHVSYETLTAGNFIFYQAFNTAPQIFNGVQDQVAIVNQPLSIIIPENAFFDLEGDNISYTAMLANGGMLPDWLVFDSNTNSFSGIPDNNDIGVLDIKITASDGSKISNTFFKLDVTGTLVAIGADRTIGYVGNDAIEIKDFLVTSTSDNMNLQLALSNKDAGQLHAGNFSSQNGVLTLSGSADNINAALVNLNFVPNSDFAGAVQINTLLHDGINNDFVSNITIQPNVAPVAVADVFYIQEDATATTISVSELLANDRDVEDFRPIFNGIAIVPEHGILELCQDGNYTYTSFQNYSGVDSFAYKIIDSLGFETSATVTINIAALNDNPTIATVIPNPNILAGNNFSLNLGQEYFIDADNDKLTYTLTNTDGSAIPSWLNFDTATMKVSGTAPLGFVGTLSLMFAASDLEASVASNFNINIASNVINSTKGENSQSNYGTAAGTDNNDELFGTVGSDLLSGGLGNDILHYSFDATWPKGFVAWNMGSPDEVINGERVVINPRFRSFDGFDGGAGHDKLILSDDKDALFLDDIFSDNPFGRDTARIRNVEEIDAGDGNDVVDLTSTKFTYGDIKIIGGAGDDVLWASAGSDVIEGGTGNDNIDGGTGTDELKGGEGDDVIHGRAGNDLIDGGLGIDILFGELGSDTFDYNAINDSVIGNSDLIKDFEHNVDKIDLVAFHTFGIQNFENLNYNYDSLTNETKIHVNDNQNIAQEAHNFELRLSGDITLSSDDFIFGQS